jgi:putative hydrolase of the HAD superfamily
MLPSHGIKAFALSMIETAVELTEGRISGRDIQSIVDVVKEMLDAEIELIDHAEQTVALLAGRYYLMLITKGDLRDQEGKIARSGLAAFFRHVEIVSDKTSSTYAALLKRCGIDPARFIMVGNSLRSDILPVLALGASAVYVPYPITWTHEAADPPPAGKPGYHRLEQLGLLPALLESLERAGGPS